MKKTVRARVNLGYTRFTTRTLDDGTVVTNVTSFQHTDPRGMIPPKLVNATIARAADQQHRQHGGGTPRLRDLAKHGERL